MTTNDARIIADRDCREEQAVTVRDFTQWLAKQDDPESQIMFAFDDGKGVVWRYSGDLGITLTEWVWADTSTPMVEIGIPDGYELVEETEEAV